MATDDAVRHAYPIRATTDVPRLPPAEVVDAPIGECYYCQRGRCVQTREGSTIVHIGREPGLRHQLVRALDEEEDESALLDRLSLIVAAGPCRQCLEAKEIARDPSGD